MDTTREGAAQPTLIFIPDISGFTEFVNTTEIQHSGHIIADPCTGMNAVGYGINTIFGKHFLSSLAVLLGHTIDVFRVVERKIRHVQPTVGVYNVAVI